MLMLMVRELELLKKFRDMSLVCEKTSSGVKLGMLKLTSGILDEIREGQKSNLILVDRLTLINQGRGGDFQIYENGVMICPGRDCVLDVADLKKMILEEECRSGLGKLFWWPCMKKEIAEFVYSCLICQKSKIQHQKPYGLMQPLSILELK